MRRPLSVVFLAAGFLGSLISLSAQTSSDQRVIRFSTPDFDLNLSSSSQTVIGLLPKVGNGFDFTPSDRMAKRSQNGFYQLGDLRFSVRADASESWRQFSTATNRKPVINIPTVVPDLAVADLSPTLPDDCPLQVIRKWTIENDRLVLRFELKNKTDKSVEVGALGIPMVFNNILTDRTLAEAHEKCSFSDPYIGRDAGYIQVTRLKGSGPALVVVPDGRTPLEAYQLLSEPTRTSQTFEGMFEWLVHSKAYADTTWKNATPWNKPTSEQIAPHASISFGVKFLVSDEIRNIERTLADNHRPVAVGIPGYILPTDIDGKLFLKYPSRVKQIDVEPKEALSVTRVPQLKSGWQPLSVHGTGWGRARLTVIYDDGTEQTIHYYVTKPAAIAVTDIGRFLFSRQWFDDPADPFKRSPSVMSFDRDADEIVTQDSRVWIAGLGDEGGSGSWLAAGMKEFIQPNRDEVAKYERFIDNVLWGGIQYKDGSNKFGVRKSLFFYSPQAFPDFAYDKSLNWTTWTSWNKDAAAGIGRGYDYPHVVAAYWSMYRIARNTENLVHAHPWQWYLDQAHQTTKFMFGRAPDGKRRIGYVELGLMEGTIFLELLDDLKREGWSAQAADVEALMKERADRWKTEEYPFGSEMAWDSTGQEEVYDWCDHFGYKDKALVSLNSIVGYMPTIPHWGYNGNARRYWDFLYAGKLRRIERQLHHYGSGLNAIPVLSYYREHPDDLYLLRIGYGGMMGALSNIDRDGFASAAFHSFPDTLRWDAYSGDYGSNFFGHAINSATYVIDHPDLGWQAFGGNVEVKGNIVKVIPRDAMRRRIYIAKFGLWLTLDTGSFESVELNTMTRTVYIALAAANAYEKWAVLRIEQPAKMPGIGSFILRGRFDIERDAYKIRLHDQTEWIELDNKQGN